MMALARGATAAVLVTLAALVACTAALPQAERESERPAAADSRVDPSGHKVRNLDALGNGNLVRDVREAHRPDYVVPYLAGRHYDYFGPYAGKRELLRPAYGYYGGSSYSDNDVPKRNFDEIDRTGFNNDHFMKRNFNNEHFTKRNFDEIDHTGFGTFIKRAPSNDRNGDLYPLPPYALRFYDY